MSQTFTKIEEARKALQAAGYQWAGFSGFTGAETFKLNGKAVFIRRRGGLWMVG